MGSCRMPSSLRHKLSVDASQELSENNIWDVVTINHILVMSQEDFEEVQDLILPSPNDLPDTTDKEEAPCSSPAQRPVLHVVDGKIIVQSTSLLSITPTTEKEVGTAPVKTRVNARRWLNKEVLLFYLGLRLFGEKFDLLSSFIAFYPGASHFSRKQVLNKYKTEMKVKDEFIEYAITNPLTPPPYLLKQFDLEF